MCQAVCSGLALPKRSSQRSQTSRQSRITFVEEVIRPWLFIVTFHLLWAQHWPQAPVSTMLQWVARGHWHWLIAQSSSSTFTSPFSTTPTAPSPTQSTEPPHQSPSSVAWISGPVIGAVALIAFVSFAIWYIRNQRRKRSTLQEYRLSYITQQEEQKHMMGMVGSSSARNELPWSLRFVK